MKKLIKSLSLTAFLMLTTGCDTSSLTLPTLSSTSEPKIDEKLPVVDAQTIKLLPDIKSVSVEWEGTSKSNINGYYIYRKDLEKADSKFNRVGTVSDKYTKHYVDHDLLPNTQYAYSVSVIGENNFESNPSDAKAIKTYPLFDSVAFVDAASNLPRKVRIQWRPHELLSIKEYILEKNTPTDAEWKKVATVKNRLNIEYIDRDLKDSVTYTYRIKAVNFEEIESNPSMSATATTKALPQAIGSLDATKDQPQKVIVKWNKSPQEDVVAYNVYMSSEADRGFKDIYKTAATDNTFEHVVTENDKTNFYKVATIDKDGLENDIKLLAPVMGKTLSAPLQPTLTLAQITPNGVILNWIKGDERAVSYTVYKTTRENFFQSSEKIIKDVTALRFEDTDVTRGVDYTYEIEAVDKFGLVSKKTKPAALSMPKLAEQKTETKSAQNSAK